MRGPRVDLRNFGSRASAHNRRHENARRRRLASRRRTDAWRTVAVAGRRDDEKATTAKTTEMRRFDMTTSGHDGTYFITLSRSPAHPDTIRLASAIRLAAATTARITPSRVSRCVPRDACELGRQLRRGRRFPGQSPGPLRALRLRVGHDELIYTRCSTTTPRN